MNPSSQKSENSTPSLSKNERRRMSSSTKTFALEQFVRPNLPKLLLSSSSRKRMAASDLVRTTDTLTAILSETHIPSPDRKSVV